MAYDATKQKTKQNSPDESQGEYLGLTSPQAQDPGAATGAAMPGASSSGPSTPTGYLNFDSYYNANSGTAARSANNVDKNVQGQVTGAQNDLGNAYSQFTGAVQAGTPGGPNQGQKNWAATGDTGVGKPDIDQKEVTATSYAPVDHVNGTGPGEVGARTVTETDQGLAGGYGDGAVPQYDANGNLIGYKSSNPDPLGATATPLGPSKSENGKFTLYSAADAAPPDYQGQVQAGAGDTYSGPNSLMDTDAYGNLTKDTTNAQTAVDNLGTNGGIQGLQGGNQFDAALTSAAGRPQFSYMQGKYGNGKLQNSLDTSVANSQATANNARSKVGDEANQYQQLLDQYNGRKSADQSSLDAYNSTHSTDASNADKIAANRRAARDDSNPVQFKSNDVTADWGLTDKDGNLLPGVDRSQIDDIYSHMNSDDAEALNNMTPAQRKAWLEQKKKEWGID